MSPLLSIVIANYNYGRFLEDAIKSVLSQNCQNYELIIIDGGSNDCSIDIIKRYSDKVSWWISEPDKGQSDAFNKGFARAKGRFLTWLNADDIMLQGTIAVLEKQVVEKPYVEWFAADTLYVDCEERIVNSGFFKIRTSMGANNCTIHIFQ